MKKLKMQTLDGVQNNIEKIAILFPNCITEKIDENGILIHAIDFDKLRQELSSELVEGHEERYQFTWPDKKKALCLPTLLLRQHYVLAEKRVLILIILRTYILRGIILMCLNA
jgi:hypothetical protein